MRFRARSKGLLIQDLDAETLVYDQDNAECHVLNASAAIVWKHCDGKRTPRELAALVAAETKLPKDEKIVELALQELQRAKLVIAVVEPARAKAKSDPPAKVPTLDRRGLIKALGLTANVALVLPVIDSILAPLGFGSGDAYASRCVMTTTVPVLPTGTKKGQTFAQTTKAGKSGSTKAGTTVGP